MAGSIKENTIFLPMPISAEELADGIKTNKIEKKASDYEQIKEKY